MILVLVRLSRGWGLGVIIGVREEKRREEKWSVGMAISYGAGSGKKKGLSGGLWNVRDGGVD